MNLNREAKVAYCAGLFEGEGTVGCYKKTGQNGPTRWCLHLQIGMTDFEPLDQFDDFIYDILGIENHVLGPYERNGRKSMYMLFYQREEDVRAICEILYPLLSIRRQQQIEGAFSILSQKKKEY